MKSIISVVGVSQRNVDTWLEIESVPGLLPAGEFWNSNFPEMRFCREKKKATNGIKVEMF